MSDFELTVPGRAPTLNSTYKVSPLREGSTRRRVYKDSDTAVWQQAVAWQVKATRPRDWQPARRVLVTLEWWMPRERDCDAGVKAALDAIAVGLGVDDRIFLLSVPVNEVDKENPRTVIRIENVLERP